MAPKVKMVGVLRFSVLTPDYYARRFPTLEETAAHLYAPDRMALRFRLFENLCLPSLLRQSDPDFHLVVLTSELMPKEYLQRLQDLLSPHKNTRLVAAAPARHYRLLQAAYDAVPDEGESHFIRFRLDDDDAVDGDFVKRTKRFAQGMIPLQEAGTPFIIAYNRGFYMRRLGPEAEIFDTCERAPLSTGTSLVAATDNRMNPYRFNHRRIAQHFNTFSDISVPSFLRTIHEDNKSNPAQIGRTHRMKNSEIVQGLKQHFGLTPEQLRDI